MLGPTLVHARLRLLIHPPRAHCSHSLPTRSATHSCTATPSSNPCGCWDWHPSSHDCWTKTEDCSTAKADTQTVSGKVVFPPPPPSGVPAEAAAAYDDASWQLVDTPHDMLIAQPFDKSANMKQAYLPRNVGWYRKHFALPADWSGSSVWLYVEGAFHETTVWLNGKPLAKHKAGYTSWWIRLDNQLAPVHYGTKGAAETNVLAFFVDASSGTGWWYEGGGLFRYVDSCACGVCDSSTHAYGGTMGY